MRKKRRSAAVLTYALAGTVFATGLALMPMARAQEVSDAALSEGPSAEELARPERADYWAARMARAAKRAAERGEPIPPGLEPPAAPEPAAAAGGGDAAPVQVVSIVDERLPSDEDLAALRQCESGGDYGINTGNGYYGAYQFLPSTWWGLGYEGYPHEAAPEVQDRAARDLWAQAGWYPWPGCSRSFGWI